MSGQPQNPARLGRTITPADAKIIVGPNGFQVQQGEKTIAEVQWNQVQIILAYTRYVDGAGTLCLAFGLPPQTDGEEDQVVVNQNVTGWPALMSILNSVFPSLDTEWAEKATFEELDLADLAPAFTANHVEVWRRAGTII